MKKVTKRIISLGLCMALTVGCIGCGKSGGNNAQSEEAKKLAAKQNVYRAEEIKGADILEEQENIQDAKLIDGKVCLLTSRYYYEQIQGYKVFLVSMNPDGSNVERTVIMDNTRTYEEPVYNDDDFYNTDDLDGGSDILEDNPSTDDAVDDDMLIPYTATEPDLDVPADADAPDTSGKKYTDDGYEIVEDSWVQSATFSENGVVIVLQVSSYYYDRDYNYNYISDTVDLKFFDLKGNEKSGFSLDANGDYVYVQQATINNAGQIMLTTDTNLLVYSEDGKKILEKPTENSGWISRLFTDKAGNFYYIRYVYTQDSNSVEVHKVDAAKQTDEVMDIKAPLSNYTIATGLNYDLFLTSSAGAFGYNFGDSDVTPILNYINSDMDNTKVRYLIETGEDSLVMICQAENWNDPLEFYQLSHVNPEDIQDKTIISVGCYYLNYNFRERIVDFNKNSDEYRITVTDYSQYADDSDYLAGMSILNNDIISGKMPDILVVDPYNMPVDSYISKGLLADFKKLIEDDPELNYEDYFENVFEAYSVDGKMYELVPEFYISTVAGKTSIVGDKPGWTMEDLKALMAKYPDASVFGSTTTRDSILWMALMFGGSQYIDKKTGKCHFDTDEFVSLLEFMKQFPEEINYEELPDNWWMEEENAYRDNKSLLYNFSIAEMERYIRVLKGQFGEPVTLIGFPAAEGNGAVVIANDIYAISAKSKCKDGAWQFLRYYLTKEYQDSNEINWNLPVMKEAAMHHLEKGMEKPYWEDSDGNREYYEYSYWNGEQEIIMDPLTREEVDALYDYICSVNQPYFYDDELRNIITEETAAFFAGQKDAKSVADIIQQRVQLYINESR